MNNEVSAYLAGAIDADGYITVKRSTYHQRVVGDATNPSYSERIGLKQTAPQVVQLLRDTFSGSYYLSKPQTANSKPLHCYLATCKIAIAICQAILPHLRIKRPQAEVLLELRRSKDPQYSRNAYWFGREYPDWHRLELITTTEVCELLGYTNRGSVSQAVRNGALLSLPYVHNGTERPRIPRLLVERIVGNLAKDGKNRNLPPELVEWRQQLYEQTRELNKLGISGTPIYYRTGPYKPAA